MSDAIRAYVNRAPVAIPGQGGHNTTLRVARTLYNGFALSRDQVLEWLEIYNRRLSEKWTKRELAHKADSAQHARYDRPRGWLITGNHSSPKRISIPTPKITRKGQKIAKKYILATDATDISHTLRMQAHAHGHSPGVSAESVANVADSPKAKEAEARRSAGELFKMHRDAAISGADDLEARFYASLLHAFGATYNGKGGA